MAKKKKQPAASTIRDRIKELRRVAASELIINPLNFRTHPQTQQDALRGVLNEIGYADALLAREREDGRLVLIDGHLRKSTTPDTIVPVLITDLTEAEANLILATLDELAAMATIDEKKLDSLLREVQTTDSAVGQMLTDMAEKHGVLSAEPTELRQVQVQRPPVMSWVLIGIPTVRFGEIAADVERLAALPDIICETTANNGPV